MTADQIWQQALGELRLQMTRATFDTWLANTRAIVFENSTLTIGVANSFVKDWLDNRVLPTVKRTLVGIVGQPVEVQFVVAPQAPQPRPSTAPSPERALTTAGEDTTDGLEVRPIYLSPRSAIVQPDRQIAATIYFLDQWLPRLGALRWALVLLLRRLCREAPLNPDGTRRMETSRRELANLLGVSTDTISRLLKSTPLEGHPPWRVISPENKQAKYLALFIPRLRYRAECVNGVTRRTGLVLDVLVEDPLTPDDNTLLDRFMASAKQQNATLRPGDAKMQNAALPGAKQQNAALRPGDAKTQNAALPGAKQQDTAGNVNINELTKYMKKEINRCLTSKRRIRAELKPVVTATEDALDDHHSTAMFYKVLMALYPDHLDLFTKAVEEALTIGQSDSEANLGAVFVATLKELAEEAGVNLGLKNG